MLWVVTFSVFLPSFTSSWVVWANPSAGHEPSNAAHSTIFFMMGPPEIEILAAQDAIALAILCPTIAKTRYPVAPHRPAPQPEGHLALAAKAPAENRLPKNESRD